MTNTFQLNFMYDDDDSVLYSCDVTCNMSEEEFNALFDNVLDDLFDGDFPDIADLGAIMYVFDQNELDDITLNDFAHNGKLLPHNVFLMMCKCVQQAKPNATFEIGRVEELTDFVILQ